MEKTEKTVPILVSGCRGTKSGGKVVKLRDQVELDIAARRNGHLPCLLPQERLLKTKSFTSDE